MDLRNSEILAILISPAFVIAITQIVRKYVKVLDGWYVALFVLVLSEIVCVVERLLVQPAQWPAGIVAGVMLAAVCLGFNDKANDIAKRISLMTPPEPITSEASKEAPPPTANP